MTVAYPNLATLQSIGKTAGNRDVWLIKVISFNKKKLVLLIFYMQLGANSGALKKTAFLDFGIHAREWISPATGAYIINEVNRLNLYIFSFFK
jgi:hypothetical protein